MEGSFELFDHTADMGIRVRAATRNGLIAPAVAGLYAAIGELKASPDDSKSFRFEARDRDDAILLRDFLTELLILFERNHELLEVDHAELGDGQITVTGRTVAVDVEKSVYLREVKAITYHDLTIREVPGGYEATMIVDI